MIKYLRKLFHTHDWTYLYLGRPSNKMGPVGRMCKKCGERQNHWKV